MSADTWTPPEPVHVFESDNHRRVLGNLGDPVTVEALLHVLHIDPYTDVWDTGTDDDVKAVESHLRDLEAAGLTTVDASGVWSMTALGLEALTGPIPNEPPPMNPIVARILNAEHDARESELIASELQRSAAEKRQFLEQQVADAEAAASEALKRAQAARAVQDQVQSQVGALEAELGGVETPPTTPPVIGGDQ